VRLGVALRARGYRFVTVTPETHRRVLMNAPTAARDLADVFGWNLPFRLEDLPREVADTLMQGGVATPHGNRFKSLVRFSTLQGRLFAHSAYPTTSVDAVFFGPDTYRFCRAIRATALTGGTVVDIGCGSGAGGIVAGTHAESITLADVNERALVFAAANAELNGVPHARLVRSDVFAHLPGRFDLIVANPPYLLDDDGRVYRDGGGVRGEALSLRILDEGLAHLAPGGSLLLYTGSAIVRTVDTFYEGARHILERADAIVHYEEVDPDVFGEELARGSYADVDRIAAVVLSVKRPPESIGRQG
jgi:SAM-dependent methyltransferase